MRSNNNNGSLYQINHSIDSTGKRVSATKRRIRWQFGFVNEEALRSGSSGVECRGHEHEVTLIWSITSGKRVILQNEQEIHSSMGRRVEGKFQYCWTGVGQHVFTIIAHASLPLNATPGFKQFDLLIDGRSFSDFSRIYEMGLSESHSGAIVPVVTNSHYNISSQIPIKNEDRGWVQSPPQIEKKEETNHLPTQNIINNNSNNTPTASNYVDLLSENNNDLDSMSSFPLGANVTVSTTVSQEQSTPQRIMSSSASISINEKSFLDNSTGNNFDLLSSPNVSNGTADSLFSEQQQDPTKPFALENNFVDEFDPNRPPSYDSIMDSIMSSYDLNSNDQPNTVVSSKEMVIVQPAMGGYCNI